MASAEDGESGSDLVHVVIRKSLRALLATWIDSADRKYLPPFLRRSTTTTKYLLHNDKSLLCLVSETVKNSQQEAAQPCVNQTVSSA